MGPGMHRTSSGLEEVCLPLSAYFYLEVTCVDHVVLFDFPRDPSEYVRRVGRTARGAGGKGKAYVFVVGKQAEQCSRYLVPIQRHRIRESYQMSKATNTPTTEPDLLYDWLR
ncbi:hypothetical protein BHM03_00048161 [Ensete ventricosum]|nr:hypothetical protein BHM03_00048161 [Ensete ventricosum]